MRKVLIVDMTGDAGAALRQTLHEAGWDVATSRAARDLRTTSADAVVVAAHTADLANALKMAAAVRQESGVPVVLITDLDRSGWDRTFGSADALSVDALFDMPVDSAALAKRLEGILDGRESARTSAADPQMTAILNRAIANEQASEAFYRRAADAVTRPHSREALESLMRDEAEHKRILEEFRAGRRALPERRPPAGSVAEAFASPDFGPEMSPADAFLLAAHKERLAVEMYENWANLYPAGPEQELLRQLAEVERAHKAKVEAMFANAAFPEAW